MRLLAERSAAALLAGAVFAFGAAGATQAADRPAPEEIKAIAEEAMVYAFPMVMDYVVLYEYAVDKGGSQYKAPFNDLAGGPEPFTPADTAVVTPNSDTPYVMSWLDLRAEPVVVCVPEIEKKRYYSVQLVSQYTYNFGYIGSRATGNDKGCYVVAGPNWTGEAPDGISKVFTSGTEFTLAIFRTQLFGPDDVPNVAKIQKAYEVKTLSAFLGKDAPEAAPAVDWPKIDKESAGKDPFGYLAFVLQFAPATGSAAVEKPLREKFASIGIEAGKPFSLDGWSDAEKAALQEGAKAGMASIKAKAATVGKNVNGWQISEDLFGTREMLGDDYLTRAVGAAAGLFGNDAAEALYPATRKDADGNQLNGATSKYTLTFPKDGFPPVNAFWSVTMYDAKSQLLVANPIKRYLINSPMLPDLTKNEDGSLTMYIQHEEPSDVKAKANWLPAPDDDIYLVMRLYWPKKEALDGSWTPPAVLKTAN